MHVPAQIIRSYKGGSYTNYLLVESIHTAKGPRQKTVCSLGDLGPRPRAEWLKLRTRSRMRSSAKPICSTRLTAKSPLSFGG